MKYFNHLAPSRIKEESSVQPVKETHGLITEPSFFPFSPYCDPLFPFCARHHRANETENCGCGNWNEQRFLLSELLRLCAADVPLSKESNPVIAPEKPLKKRLILKVCGCTGQHPGHNVCNGVNAGKKRDGASKKSLCAPPFSPWIIISPKGRNHSPLNGLRVCRKLVSTIKISFAIDLSWSKCGKCFNNLGSSQTAGSEL